MAIIYNQSSISSSATFGLGSSQRLRVAESPKVLLQKDIIYLILILSILFRIRTRICTLEECRSNH